MPGKKAALKLPLLDNNSEMLLDAAGFEPVDIEGLACGTG